MGTGRGAQAVVPPSTSTGRFGGYCEGVIEACWLLTVVLAPLLFDVYSARGFEPDKTSCIRSLAVLAVAAWWIRWIEEPGQRLNRSVPGALFRGPLRAAIAAVVFSLLLSTALSLTPAISFFGSYDRLQGTFTTLCYVALFAATARHLRRRDQVERIVTALVLASLPVALYGIVQRLGLDPLPWVRATDVRVSSTLGNPVFLAAHLALVVPLLAGRIVLGLVVHRARTWVKRLRIAGYLVILVADLLAIGWSQSRGPLLGLLAGGFLFLLLVARGLRTRWLAWGAIGLAAVTGLCLVLLNVQGGPLESVKRRVPALWRLGTLADTASGSARVRILVWHGVSRLVRPHEPLEFPDGRADRWNALRPWVGYGPETLQVAFSRFHPPEMAAHEVRQAVPDRAHNETWDVLASGGLLGLAAHLALLWGVLYHGLRWLGVGNPRERVAWLLAGAALGTLVAVFWGGVSMFGAGLPLGLVGGVTGLAAVSTMRRPAAWTAQPWDGIVRAGLLAALVAHVVEIQFGVAVASTRMSFWILLAALFVCGEVLPAAHGTREDGPLSSIGAGAGLVAALLVVLGFGFIGGSQPPAGAPYVVAAMLAATWLGGGLLALFEEDRAAGRRFAATGLATVLAGSLGVGAVAWIVLGRRLAALAAPTAAQPAALLDAADRLAGLFHMLCALLLMLVAAWGAALRGAAPAVRRGTPGRPIAAALCAGAAAVAAVLSCWVWNVQPIHADIVGHAGLQLESNGQPGLAAALFERSIELAPRQDTYRMWLGRARLGELRATVDPVRQGALLEGARKALEQAQALNPLHPDHTANLARLMREWSRVTDGAPERAARLAEANRHYAAALRLAPQRAELWNEWAELLMKEAKDPMRAQEKLDRSFELDRRFEPTLRLQAELDALRAAPRSGEGP